MYLINIIADIESSMNHFYKLRKSRMISSKTLVWS